MKHQSPEANWAYDKLQFARLVAEAEAAGVWEDSPAVDAMLASMDLDRGRLSELVDRAQEFWDTHKEPAMRVLVAPMTVDEARARADAEDWIEGVVTVELSELVDRDLEGVLDLLGERLVEGGECLSATECKVVGQQGDTLYVRVAGDASLVFEIAQADGRSEPGPYIAVEYDLTYGGGDYDGIGAVAYVPVRLIGEHTDEAGFDAAVRRAFSAMTTYDPVHIVHYSDEEVDEHGDPWDPLRTELLVRVGVDAASAGRTDARVQTVRNLVGREPVSVDHVAGTVDVLFHVEDEAEARRHAALLGSLSFVIGTDDRPRDL